MNDSYLNVACYPSLLIFVDGPGQVIFQKLVGITRHTGLDSLVQEYTGVIFYRSRLRKARAGWLHENISFDNPDTYQLSLENAISAQLDALLRNKELGQRLISNGYSIHAQPHILIIGSYQAAGPGIVLNTVDKVLANYAQNTAEAPISYLLTGRYSPPVRSEPALEQAIEMPIDNVRPKPAPFCYVYSHNSSSSDQQRAFFAAASALYLMIGTDLIGQPEFQYALQHSGQRVGRLFTCLLTFPGQELREYIIKQLSSSLMHDWIEENNVVVTLPDLGEWSDPDLSLNLTSMDVSIPQSQEVLGPMSVAQHNNISSILRYLRVRPETEAMKLFDQYLMPRSVDQHYMVELKDDPSIASWRGSLSYQAQEAQSAWEAQARDHWAHVQNAITQLIQNDIYRILQSPTDKRSLALVRAYLDRVKQVCEQELPALPGGIEERSNQAHAGNFTTQETSGQLKHDQQEEIHRRLEKLLKEKPSLFTSFMTLILTSGVAFFLLANRFSFVLGWPVLIAGLLVGVSFLSFFLWQRRQIEQKQKKLIEMLRSELNSQVEKVWYERQKECISTLHKDFMQRLETLKSWLNSWQRQLQIQAEEELEALYHALSASPYFHVCNSNLLMKNELDRHAIEQYYRLIVYPKIEVEEILIDGQWTMQKKRASLYQQLFDLSGKQNPDNPPEEGQLPISLQKELSDFLGHVFDEIFWGTSKVQSKTASVELKLAGENKEMWQKLLTIFLQPDLSHPDDVALALVCKCSLDLTINERWLFAAALFEEDITPFFHSSLLSVQKR